MSESDWLSFTGAITGVIGAITGIAGAVMGYIGYRRTEQLKALDLRLELRKSENTLRADVQDLAVLLEQTKKSHTAVASAIGQLGSGALKQWLDQLDTDVALYIRWKQIFLTPMQTTETFPPLRLKPSSPLFTRFNTWRNNSEKNILPYSRTMTRSASRSGPMCVFAPRQNSRVSYDSGV